MPSPPADKQLCHWRRRRAGLTQPPVSGRIWSDRPESIASLTTRSPSENATLRSGPLADAPDGAGSGVPVPGPIRTVRRPNIGLIVEDTARVGRSVEHVMTASLRSRVPELLDARGSRLKVSRWQTGGFLRRVDDLLRRLERLLAVLQGGNALQRPDNPPLS